MQMMQPSGLMVAIYFVVVISVSGFLDYEIIEGYFRKRFISYAAIIGCFPQKEQLQIAKKFSPKLMTSVLNLNKIDVQQIVEENRHLGVILDGDCTGADLFFKKCKDMGKLGCFDEKHHWLILASQKNFTKLFDNVEMYINADIEVIYPEENTTAENYTIKAIYNSAFSLGGSIKTYTIGYYNALEGYSIIEEHAKYALRRNMTGVHLRTMVVLPIPYRGTLSDYLDSVEDRGINTFNRYHYNMLSMCQNFYNFTKEVSASKSWGYLQKDGTFDGLVGALERNQVDYGSSPIFVKPERFKVVQYGRQTWILGAAFIFRNPKSLTSLESFVKPLSYSTWALVAASAILLIVLLRLSCLYEHKNVRQHIEISWSYFTICIIGAFCQQGMSVTPHFSSGRIVTLFLFLFTLLIYQFYSASIVSNLLMEPPTKIKTLDDMGRSNLKLVCQDVLYNREYFAYSIMKSSKKLYFGKLSQVNSSSDFFVTPEEGLELVAKGQYAFHVERTTAYPIIQKTFQEETICELREVNLYQGQALHTVFQKNTPYKEMFDSCLQHIAEVGIMTRELIFWQPPKPDCILSSKVGTFNIGLDQFYPALALLGFGIICSLVVLLFEMFFFYKKMRRAMKENEVLLFPFNK